MIFRHTVQSNPLRAKAASIPSKQEQLWGPGTPSPGSLRKGCLISASGELLPLHTHMCARQITNEHYSLLVCSPPEEQGLSLQMSLLLSLSPSLMQKVTECFRNQQLILLRWSQTHGGQWSTHFIRDTRRLTYPKAAFSLIK